MSISVSEYSKNDCEKAHPDTMNVRRDNYLSITHLPKLPLFFLFLIFFHYGFGQDISSKIDKKDLRAFIETLSSPQFGGRSIDDDGQFITQEFIVNRFKELKLETLSPDSYLEKFYLQQISRRELFLKTQYDRTLQNLDRMIYEGEIKRFEAVAVEVVFGGYGTEEELNQINVINRYVLIILKNQSEEIVLKKRLGERLACGIIIVYEDDKNFDVMKDRVKDFYVQKKYSIAGHLSGMTATSAQIGEQSGLIPVVNSIKIPGAEVKNMMGLSKNKLVGLANKRKIKDVPPVMINLHFEQVEKIVETANVIGVIRGESEQAIVVSAHYDHVGKEENFYYPGADDNASGVAALLELAEAFTQTRNLKYTMIFLATTAEEAGLLGSLYHTRRPDFDPEKIICNVNIDMISRCDNKHTDCEYLYCINDDQSEMLYSLVRKANVLFPLCTFDYAGNNVGIFERTDGFNFMKKGVPSILFFTGFHDDYHKPTDTMEKINFDILENRIKLICEVIKLIQNE